VRRQDAEAREQPIELEAERLELLERAEILVPARDFEHDQRLVGPQRGARAADDLALVSLGVDLDEFESATACSRSAVSRV